MLVVVIISAGLLYWLSKRPFVPNNYTQKVETGGALEAKYLAMGSHDIKYVEAAAPEDWGNFIAYYPSILESCDASFPAVVFVNGTGVPASRYTALFRHLASWGFIVVGNEDPGTFSGDSADAAVTWLIGESENPGSIFYRKVDAKRIGISGHSQGGVGVFNAIKNQPHGSMYACAVSLSPTDIELAEAIGIPYDPEGVSIPTLILASKEGDVINASGVQRVYDAISSDKAAALRVGANHGEMLYCGDGYVTAWFMYWLQGDKEAGTAFWGIDAELHVNPLWELPPF